jgi:hypothetical protein
VMTESAMLHALKGLEAGEGGVGPHETDVGLPVTCPEGAREVERGEVRGDGS